MMATGFLFIAALFLSAVLGEAMLRLMGYRGVPESVISNMYPVDDPVLDWRYRPHSQVVIGKVVNSYNSRGYRDIEHSLEPRPGIRRVVVIGDSVTEGYGVEADSVFSARLREGLGKGFEVINLGMAGLNTPQEVHLLGKEGLQYRPDIVILNFVLNDADFFTTYRGAQRAIGAADQKIGMFNWTISPKAKRMLKSSALIYFIKERIENLQGWFAGESPANYYRDLWNIKTSRDKVKNGIEELYVMKNEYKFEIIVVIWPVLTDYSSYPFKDIHDWVETAAREKQFNVIDLLPVFASYDFRSLQVAAEDNVHPNVLGHKLAAEAVVKSINEINVVGSL